MNDLTPAELVLIVNALHAVSPSGGGSATYHLANKIANAEQVTEDYRMQGHFQTIAHDEFVEAHEE
jgi:hypothetical protein